MKPLLRRIPLIGSVPALPLVTNSDAEAAYSLRKLTPSYSGSAVRIRRSSDDAEQDIGFNGLDFDTSSAESFCGAGDGFVTTWYDQSGNGNDATQATAGDQPQIVSSGSVVTENGKPAVDFDGSNDNLRVDIGIYTQPNTFFTVQKLNSGASSFRTLISDIRNDSNNRHVIGQNNTDEFTNYAGDTLSSGTSFNTQFLWYSLFNTTSSISSINGVESLGNVGSEGFDGIVIGNTPTTSRFWSGTIQEIIFYPSAKISSRTVIENDINRYYNIF